MEESLIAINMVVGDRTYRIRIDPVNEEVVRKTVKTINDKILEFKTNFAGKDMQDYVAMVVLWYATSLAGNLETGVSGDSSDRLNGIEALLDRVLGG
jgi:hypothetical protein